jgi:ribonuclease VapC
MFVDASAIVAILVGEDEAAALAGRLDEADEPSTSPIAVYEAVLGIARIANVPVEAAQGIVDRFLEEAGIETLPVTAEIGRAAASAFGRFGKGRHPAALNLGDCFAYACASALGVPLLYKGNDFSRTDIAAA